jgi:Curlin associated repeat
MKMLHTLTLSVLLLVPLVPAQALDVQVDVCVQTRQNNSCKIKQDGTHNLARGAQRGENNDLDIEQRGENNDAKGSQKGLRNDLDVDQRDRL